MNRFTELLNEGRQPLGMFIESCSSYVVEATGQTGLDYIILDNEHSPIDAETSAELIRAAELAGLTPFCRVREISRSSVLKLLDVGAQGLIVPNVKTAEEVKNLVKWAKYAPIGERGFCPSRKDGFGWRLKLSVAETMALFNREVLLIPQCETAEALAQIEEIAALPGVDGIFIGRSTFRSPWAWREISKTRYFKRLWSASSLQRTAPENSRFCLPEQSKRRARPMPSAMIPSPILWIWIITFRRCKKPSAR